MNINVEELIDTGIYNIKSAPMDIARHIAENYCSFSDEELKMMDIFWDAAFNKNWLYVSDEIVENMLGYTKSKNMMSDFGVKLMKEFEVNIDYQIVDSNHVLIKEFYSGLVRNKKERGISKKYYIVTGETFKNLAMSAKTEKGKQTRKYFIKVENLAITTTNILFECSNIILSRQLKEKEKLIEESKNQIEESKNQILNLKKLVICSNVLKKDEIFYIATSEAYAANNRFKYGGVARMRDLSGRLSSYNTGRAEGDLFYFCKIIKCNSYKNIEGCIDKSLKVFKDKQEGKKEMLYMNFECINEFIDFVSDNYDRIVDFTNDNVQKYIDATSKNKPVIPPPIIQENSLLIARNIGGELTQIKKIDVSKWSEEQINDLIKRLINEYARTKLGTEYDFEVNKNSANLQIVWREFKEHLEKYKGKNLTSWRAYMKIIAGTAKNLQVKWR